MSPRTIDTLVVVAVLLSVVLGGCKPQEQIEAYRVPRTTAPRAPLDTEAIASQFDHILVAIVPQGDQAWFFKLVGSARSIDRQREAFRDFLATVTVDNAGKKPPKWKAPENWEERPASEMRAATLVIPDEDGPLELAVSSLPLSSDWKSFVFVNVNRWLGQLGQPSLDQASIDKLTRETAVEGGAATVIELTGIMSKPPMSGNPHVAAKTESPPKQTSAEQAKNQHLEYKIPEGWAPGRMSAMRKAAFQVVDGDAEAEVTVIDLPANGASQVADVEANIKRWAGQVGLTDLDADAVEQLAQPITIDGAEGIYAELYSPEDAEQSQAMLIAMVVRQEKVWFIKMFGPRGIVQSQQEAFRSFLSSIKF